jgi:hypothetical protein
MVATAPPKPIDPIRVTPEAKQRLDPIERWFIVVLRLIALVLLARAIFGWFVLTGFLQAVVASDAIAANPTLHTSLLVVVCTLSVIAAVGLWLLAPWGAVLWLTLVVLDAVLFFTVPGLNIASLTLVLMNAGLITIYLGLLLQVRRHSKQAATL